MLLPATDSGSEAGVEQSNSAPQSSNFGTVAFSTSQMVSLLSQSSDFCCIILVFSLLFTAFACNHCPLMDMHDLSLLILYLIVYLYKKHGNIFTNMSPPPVPETVPYPFPPYYPSVPTAAL